MPENRHDKFVVDKIAVTVEQLTSYSTTPAGTAVQPSMTPSKTHPAYHFTSSQENGAVRNDSGAPLSGSFSSYAQYNYTYVIGQWKKSEAETVRLYFLH